jgi:hypothetical protein
MVSSVIYRTLLGDRPNRLTKLMKGNYGLRLAIGRKNSVFFGGAFSDLIRQAGII